MNNYGNSNDSGEKLDSSKGTEENRTSTFMKGTSQSPIRTEGNQSRQSSSVYEGADANVQANVPVDS